MPFIEHMHAIGCLSCTFQACVWLGSRCGAGLTGMLHMVAASGSVQPKTGTQRLKLQQYSRARHCKPCAGLESPCMTAQRAVGSLDLATVQRLGPKVSMPSVAEHVCTKPLERSCEMVLFKRRQSGVASLCLTENCIVKESHV